MLYTRPYVTRRFIAYAGDSRSSDLSLAVAVVDAFTEEPPQIAIRVRLKPTESTKEEDVPRRDALRNQSGFFYYEGLAGLAAGDYLLVIELDRTTADWFFLKSDAADWKDIFEQPIKLPMPNAKDPRVTVTLVPKSSYPFPANATLVRGKVMQGTAVVSDAIVSTTYKQIKKEKPNDPIGPEISVEVKTLTDREGDFVLFFKRLAKPTQPIDLTAEKNGNQLPLPVTVTITEGKTLPNPETPAPIILNFP